MDENEHVEIECRASLAGDQHCHWKFLECWHQPKMLLHISELLM